MTRSRSSSRSRSSTSSTRKPARRSPRRGRPSLPDEAARDRPHADHADGPSADHAAGPHADQLAERIVDSHVLHRGRYLTFRIDTIERNDGSRATREICGHPGAVAILAIDEADRILFVRQWRVAAGGALLEIPAGTLDVDQSSGTIEDHALAAPRELEEETGYRAGRWRLLSSFWTAPGFATELMHLYLATDLRPAHGDRLGPDEDERLELERLSPAEALAAIERGEIVDAKSILGILWLARLGMTETMPAIAETSRRP